MKRTAQERSAMGGPDGGGALDAEVVELASTAGMTLVKLMTTDLWGQAKNAIAGLFGRHLPDRDDDVAGQLELSRGELVAAEESGDELTASELAEQWSRRLRWLLSTDPSAVQPLRDIVAELTPQLPAEDRQQIIRMKAVAKDNARIYMAGRDQHIS